MRTPDLIKSVERRYLAEPTGPAFTIFGYTIPPYWDNQCGPGVLITMDSGEEWFHSHRGGAPLKLTEKTKRHLYNQ